MTDERYKELMKQVGMPNSKSLLIALRQVANEVAQEFEKSCPLYTNYEKSGVALKERKRELLNNKTEHRSMYEDINNLT